MDKKHLEGARPAPFPNSSWAEQDSADIFHNLLDRKYIRGNVSVMDKMPNSDGVLTFIDEQQYPIGQFEVQLKTLPSGNKSRPRFQCELSLLAYALDTILPMILAVVDKESKLVYWLHLDEKLIDNVNPKAGANSVMLPLSHSQVIDRNNRAYISDWKKIIETVKYKLCHFDQLEQQRNAFQTLLGGPNPRLLPAYSLNELAIREIHIFLDLLNSKLDHEFKSIKEMLYYHYWKMAIAISIYQADDLAFLILPLPLSSNSPLILEIADHRRPSLDDLFAKDKALIMMHTQDNTIKEAPQMLALELINHQVFKVVGKRNFPTADRYLAEEYVYGFANRFCSLLGLSPWPDQVDIKHVLRTIFVLVPLNRDISYGASTEHITLFIDHLMAPRDTEYAKMLEKAENTLADGMSPNPNLKLALQTGLFDLDLLRFYLDFLDNLGLKSLTKPLLDMKNDTREGGYVWSSWNLENIFINVSEILEQFPRIYNRVVHERFPLIKVELDLYQKDSVILYILCPKYQGGKPRLLYYRFLALGVNPLRKLLLFHQDDPKCPLSLRDDDSGLIWKKNFEFSDISHKLRATGEMPLEIFMGSSPLHRLVGDTLGRFLDRYFKSQGLKKTDYQEVTAYN